MVRLKGTAINNETLIDNISIPYGAIKSIMQMDSWVEHTSFQFLMVRLKETLLTSKSASHYFNSLWCD